MSDEVRQAIGELVEEAAAELDRAVGYHDAVATLRELVWLVDADVALYELDDVERQLEPLAAARWRNALAAATRHSPDPNNPEEPHQ